MTEAIGRPVFVGNLEWDRIESLQRGGIRRWQSDETDMGARVRVEAENHFRAIELTSPATP